MSDYGVNIYRRVFEIDSNGVPVRQEVVREALVNVSKPSLKKDLVFGDTNLDDISVADIIFEFPHYWRGDLDLIW